MPSSPSTPRSPPRSALGPSWAACPDKPTFHVMPTSGWVNDPNGLCWCAGDGRFHAFYQHVCDAPAWAWGSLSWGHASTADLATWRHEPLALRPSPGDHDAAGVWSGCCVPGGGPDGRAATILYTGVHLRPGLPGRDPAHSRDGGRHPPLPPGTDVGLEQHECQLAAVCEGGDGAGLTRWRKVAAPTIPHAPAGLAPGLGGFRDPFIFQRWEGEEGKEGGQDGGVKRPWRLVLGSGRGGRGCLLAYASRCPDPAAPAWAFEGVAASGEGLVVRPPEVAVCTPAPSPSSSPVDGVDIGEMWECPLVARLVDESGAAWALVCVSPYPHTHARGRPTNPPIFWLVEAEKEEEKEIAATLDLAAAAVGPLRLDLGDVLYAPTAAAGAPTTAAGRAAVGSSGGGGPSSPLVLMGWLQDLRPPAADGAHAAAADASASPAARAADYAGCLSVPRVVTVRDGWRGTAATPRLHQAPAPGLAALRRPPPGGLPPWPADTTLLPGAPTPLPIPGVSGDAVDIEVTFVRDGGGANTEKPAAAAGLWLRRALAITGDAPGVAAPTAAALVVDWAAGRLEVIHFTRILPCGAPDWGSAVRRAGGACAGAVAGRVALRALCDQSAVEVFADSGEALATRVYGCGGDSGAHRAWELFAVGCATGVPSAAGWEMRAGWEREKD
jgi:sucrose-6-phosphate hydrolase SacC (GH32 family)